MSIKINLVKRSVKERLWKTVSTVVGISTILNVSMVGLALAPQVAKADTAMPGSVITATYDPTTGQLNTSGTYTWTACSPSNTSKIVGQALFIDGPDADSIVANPSQTPVTTEALEGTGMHLLNNGQPCTTTPDNWTDNAHNKTTNPILATKPNLVCVVTYHVALNATSGSHSQIGAGTGYNTDSSWNMNGSKYLSTDCTIPTSTVGSISGMKYNDLNGNGSKDSGEPGLVNWTINLDKNADGSVDASTTTDANGNYSFTNLSAARYRVREVAQAGWTQKSSNPADIVLNGQDVTGVNFGNQGACAMVLTKTVDKTDATPGQTLTYNLKVQNTGTANCTGGGVRFDDVIPAGTSYVVGSANPSALDSSADFNTINNTKFGYIYNTFGPANPNGYNGTMVTWNAHVLPPGASATASFQVTVNSIAACTTKDIPNSFKAYSDQIPTGVVSNTVNTHITTSCNGSLQLTKIVDSGSASADSFNFTISPDPNSVGTIHPTNGTYLFTNLPQGQYTVTEQAKTDYHQVSSTCSNVQVTANQQATCVVHNARDTGTLKVIKHVVNAAGSNATADLWSLHVKQNGSDVATSPQNGSESGTVYTLPTGTYNVSETGGPAGYTASFSASCSNGSIDVISGQQAVCTITNTRDSGTIIVNQKLDTDGNGSFESGNTTANGLGYAWSLDGGATNRTMGSSAAVTTIDNHAVNENGVSGYHFVGWYWTNDGTHSCTNPQATSLPVNFTVANGETKDVTLCAARDTGTLVIQKDVINPDNGAVSDTHQFTVTVSGQSNGTIAEGTNATYSNLPTGSYTVTELADGSYTFVSYSLDTDANAGNGAQVTVSKDQTTTLLVTNKQKKVSIVVHKNVVGIDGQTDVSDSHGFTANVNSTSGTIAEGSNFTTQVNPGNVHVSENADANYALVSITPADFTVHSGDQPVNVYVVNKQLPAHITVYKDVRAWDGSDVSDGHTFMVTLNNITKNFGENAPASYDVAPGTYSANELADANYTLDSISPAQVTVGSNGSAQITVTNKQNKVFDWTVTKTGPATVQAGGQMTYDISWQINANSNTQLANITVTDPLPAHTSFVSCSNSCDHSTSTISWSIPGPFAPGQSGVVHLTVAVDNNLNPLQITNIATVCGDQQPFVPTLSLTALNLDTVNGTSPTHVCKNGSVVTQLLSSYTLGVSKTDNQTTTTPGSTYSYTVNWNVSGNAASTSALVVKDTLPAHTSFVSASNGGTNNAGVVTWNLGSKSVPSNGTLTVTVKADDLIRNGTDLHNTVQLCDDSQQCVTGDDHTRVVSDYQVNVTKTGAPEPANPDQNVTYTLNWTLSGNAPVDSLTLTDTLPAGVSFVGASNGGTNNAGTVTWNLGSFPTGQGNGSVTVTVHLPTPLASGTTFTNTAQICGSSTSLGDQAPVNHCDSDQFITHVTSDFGVTIDKARRPYTATAGNNGTHTQTRAVGGNAPVNTLALTDTFPAGASFVRASNGGTNNAGTVTWNLGAHVPGDHGTLTLIVMVASPLQNGSHLSNTAQVCGTSGQTTHCNTDTEITTVNSDFSVGLVKTAASTVNAGDQLIYTLHWTLNGNESVNPVVITDAIPANTTFVSASNGGTNTAGTVTWNLGAHVPGDSGDVTLTVNVNKPLANGTVISNTGQVCATATNQNDTTTQHCGTSTTTTTVNSDFSVDIVKTAPSTVNAGGSLSYVLTWSTSGNAPIDNLVITDPLPANTTFVSASNGGTNNAGTVTWNLGAHAPGDHGSVTLNVTVASPLQNGTLITNTGKICGVSESVDGQRCDTDTTTTTVTSDFGVDIAKAGPATATPGNQLTYVLTWTTTGTTPISSVIITDPLPANTSFVSATNGGTNNAGTVTWNLGAHVPGDGGTVTLVVKLNSPLANGTKVDNTGQICAQATGVDGQKCDTSTTTTTVSSSPSLSIAKTNDVVGFTNPGKTVTYTVTVTNAAGATDTAHTVVLTDVLPSGFTYTVGGGSTKNFSLGDIAPGASVITTYTAVINAAQAAGTYTNTASAQGNNTSKVSATSNVEVRVPQILGATTAPNLTITKTVKPTTANPGQTITYTVTIKNTGDGDAKNVVLTDTLPSGLTFLDTGKSTQTWDIGTLAANHDRVINYLVKVGSTVKAGTYKNLAVVTASDLSPQQATATLTVKVPQVLGLATTGVSLRDYLTFAAGLILMGLGVTWLVRGNRRHATELA